MLSACYGSRTEMVYCASAISGKFNGQASVLQKSRSVGDNINTVRLEKALEISRLLVFNKEPSNA